MQTNTGSGWEKFLEEYPWFNCNGCYPLIAYSEFMPSPKVGYKPYGKPDNSVLSKDDPYGWKISELEEEYELKPGIEHTGQQIMKSIIKLGKGIPEHFISGHGGENLKDNPYWPPELSSQAGKLNHERYVALLPMMLSRTQDDKGRVIWTLFGNSIHDPGKAFWKSFFSAPGLETEKGYEFFSELLSEAYGEKPSMGISELAEKGFGILPSTGEVIPAWATQLIVNENDSFEKIKYLVTFRPFQTLPGAIKTKYLSGRLNLLPFPGSLVFWGMPGYNKLKKQAPSTGQIPLLNLVARHRGIGSLRVTQSGWLHEPYAGNSHTAVNESLVHDSFHRTHRWQRIHRYQDELNEIGHKVKLISALFSTDPDAMGLYNKPLACNSQIWNHKFDLLLDGPSADKKKLTETEKILAAGGLFGYRFFYPPMRVGKHEVYLHRPLVAYEDSTGEKAVVKPESLYGYITGYNTGVSGMTDPVELWPRMLKREIYLSAMHNFNTHHDHFSHQTSFNIISLFEAWEKQERKPLTRSFAQNLLNIPKHKTFDDWLNELDIHANSQNAAREMREAIAGITEPSSDQQLPEAITFGETATRKFEEAWWEDIRFLAHGEFIYKDNADIMHDDATLQKVIKKQRDLEFVGDYFLHRYRKAIADAGMEGKAVAGELPFRWTTLFDFTQYGGWTGNQKGSHYERNILMVIPGKNRKQAVVFGDHYDTAYMEDIYEKARGGSGARLAADGADDNYSATSTLLQAAPIFLNLSKQGLLERDIWLINLTGEEFPSDCMGARSFCQQLIEKNLNLKTEDGKLTDLSATEIVGVYVMDMIGHNRDNDQDIFQISPGKSAASLNLARQAHISNLIWNNMVHSLNHSPERLNRNHGKRISGTEKIPEIAKHLSLKGEVRTQYNPHSSIFNTDGQIFSDTGVPVVLFMENYDINRTGYHDTHDTLENIDLDYGAAFAAIAIETVARVAAIPAINK